MRTTPRTGFIRSPLTVIRSPLSVHRSRLTALRSPLTASIELDLRELRNLRPLRSFGFDERGKFGGGAAAGERAVLEELILDSRGLQRGDERRVDLVDDVLRNA